MGLLYSLIYLIKHASFLPAPINIRFANLERVMRCVCPLRNQYILVYTLCTHRADPGPPIAIST